jgi:hypothetical protein
VRLDYCIWNLNLQLLSHMAKLRSTISPSVARESKGTEMSPMGR